MADLSTIPKKVLFMGISSHLGGAEKSLLDFLKTYNRAAGHWDILVLLPHAEGPLNNRLREENIRVEVMEMPERILKISKQNAMDDAFKAIKEIPAFLWYLIRLTLFIRRQKFSVVHSTGLKCHLILCLISPFLRARILLHWRDILSSEALKSFFQLFKSNPQIQWLANSKATQKSLAPISAKVVYNGFDFQPPAARTPSFRETLGISPSTRLVGMIGVLSRWKGQREFILAAHQLCPQMQDVHFVIVGDQIYDTSTDKNYKAQLEALVKNLELDSQVHFCGFVNDPLPLMRELDLLVHASLLPEPFGRVLIEGIISQTPVLAARAGGALEILTENETGYFHTPGDVKDLSEKITMILKDEDRHEIVKRAFDRSKELYSLDTYVKNLKQIIENA